MSSIVRKESERVFKEFRSLVSRDKYRFKDETLGVDLDFTYITPRVVAMGLPATSMATVWRNNVDHVAAFFNHYHPTRFMIINLSESSYDASKFKGQVRHFPFPDHHAPPLKLLLEIVTCMHSWIQSHRENIVAVHCLAGRGRTGTIISCYFLWSGEHQTANDALNAFAHGRSSTKEGVLLPSQIRYTHYVDELVRKGRRPIKRKVLTLNSISIHPIPLYGTEGWALVLKILDPHTKAVYFTNIGNAAAKYRPGDYTVTQDIGVQVENDVLIRVYHESSLKKAVVFRVMFHTSFIKNMEWTLTKKQLDAPKAGPFRDSHVPESFSICLRFSAPLNQPNKSPQLSPLNTVFRSRKEGIAFTDPESNTLVESLIPYYEHQSVPAPPRPLIASNFKLTNISNISTSDKSLQRSTADVYRKKSPSTSQPSSVVLEHRADLLEHRAAPPPPSYHACTQMPQNYVSMPNLPKGPIHENNFAPTFPLHPSRPAPPIPIQGQNIVHHRPAPAIPPARYQTPASYSEPAVNQSWIATPKYAPSIPKQDNSQFGFFSPPKIVEENHMLGIQRSPIRHARSNTLSDNEAETLREEWSTLPSSALRPPARPRRHSTELNPDQVIRDLQAYNEAAALLSKDDLSSS